MRGVGTSSLALAAVVLIASTLAEHSTTQVIQKDAGDLAETEESKQPQPEFDLHKYQELREPNKHLRVPDAYLERLLSDQLEKRASMRGFQGMRGKKHEYDLPYDGQFFEPLYNDISYYYDKRGPMGFQGMRGKKSLEEVLDELEKRSKVGFQGMRGKKSEEYEEQLQPQNIEEYRKRAPMGFQDMRDRKSSFLDELDELEKRAILGFHGMRGKKDMAYDREGLPIDIEGYVEKRPMMMGFHGMRGKRSANYYAGKYEKRSPYRYFGTRGKKNPRWEVFGKFVGVRGKKWMGGPRRLPAILYEELTEPSRH